MIDNMRADIRRQVLSRDDNKCTKCGKNGNLHVHHKIARSNGGDDAVDNLLTVCGSCHKAIEPVIRQRTGGSFGYTQIRIKNATRLRLMNFGRFGDNSYSKIIERLMDACEK